MGRKFLLILGFVLLSILLLTSVAFAENVYIDINESHWAYDAINELDDIGLFYDIFILGEEREFKAEEPVSKAEFLALLVKNFYQRDGSIEEYKQENDVWWKAYYDLAIARHIIDENDIDYESLESNCTREEMIYITIKFVNKLMNEKANYLIDKNAIFDFDDIDEKYQYSIQKAYTLGLIDGIDNEGEIFPKSELTRAQAAEILYRLNRFDKRVVHDIEPTEINYEDALPYVIDDYALPENPKFEELLIGRRVPGGKKLIGMWKSLDIDDYTIEFSEFGTYKTAGTYGDYEQRYMPISNEICLMETVLIKETIGEDVCTKEEMIVNQYYSYFIDDDGILYLRRMKTKADLDKYNYDILVDRYERIG